MYCEHAITPCPHQPKAFLSRLLSLSSSLNHVVFGVVYYDTTFNIPDDFKYCQLKPQTNTGLFSTLCFHSHIFRKTSQNVTHPKICFSQAHLNVDFLWD